MELAIYESEGISCDKVDYTDNQTCLDMIEGKPVGILSILDEQSVMPKANDLSFVNKLHQTFGEKKAQHINYARNIKDPSSFVVKHYAGEVEYASDGFLGKNNDKLNDSIVKLFQASSSDLIRHLFDPDAGFHDAGLVQLNEPKGTIIHEDSLSVEDHEGVKEQTKRPLSMRSSSIGASSPPPVLSPRTSISFKGGIPVEEEDHSRDKSLPGTFNRKRTISSDSVVSKTVGSPSGGFKLHDDDHQSHHKRTSTSDSVGSLSGRASPSITSPNKKKKGGNTTLANQFKSQLNSLIDVLGLTEPHFIRYS